MYNSTTMVCKLRSEEVVIRKSARGNFLLMAVTYGNTEIHMCTKFHFHALYGVQV